MPGLKKRAAGGRKSNVIRVLVAEDHTVVRDGLVAIIKQEADMDVVAETGDGQQAAELWKKHRPHITLMDLRMPGLDGVNAIYQIRAADPNARISVLTTYDGDEDIYRGMCAGAKSPNKLIGADLTITEVTVKSHVQSVFRKLNVLSRTEAIAVANRRGLLHL